MPAHNVGEIRISVPRELKNESRQNHWGRKGRQGRRVVCHKERNTEEQRENQ
jgi:hypothetical protein